MKKPRLDVTEEIVRELLKDYTATEAAKILGCSTRLIKDMRCGVRTALDEKPKWSGKKCACGKLVAPGNYFLCYECYGNTNQILDEDFLVMT